MVAAMQGKLYAVAGDDCYADTLDSVEAFDPQQNRWEAVASLAREYDVGAVDCVVTAL